MNKSAINFAQLLDASERADLALVAEDAKAKNADDYLFARFGDTLTSYHNSAEAIRARASKDAPETDKAVSLLKQHRFDEAAAEIPKAKKAAEDRAKDKAAEKPVDGGKKEGRK